MTALQLVRKFYPDVKAVKDATKGIEIEVTPADTKSKAVRNHTKCAFAVACERSHVADATIISLKTSYLIKGDTAYRYTTPEHLAREIVAFDREGKFEPGEYGLVPPAPTARLGAVKPNGRGHGSKDRKPNYKNFKKVHPTQAIRTNLKEVK